MNSITGNIWQYIEDVKTDILLVPTNGYVNPATGFNVMGAGFAKQVKERWPHIPETLGKYLHNTYLSYMHNHDNKVNKTEPWNIPYPIEYVNINNYDMQVWSFPTKQTFVYEKDDMLDQYTKKFVQSGVPGWQGKSKLYLIQRSAYLISKYINTIDPNKSMHIVSVKPGCSNGHLHWTDVKPILEKYWDNRYTIVDAHT